MVPSRQSHVARPDQRSRAPNPRSSDRQVRHRSGGQRTIPCWGKVDVLGRLSCRVTGGAEIRRPPSTQRLDETGPRSNVHLAEHPGSMVFDRSHRQVQDRADLGVGVPEWEQVRDLAPSTKEVVGPGAVASPIVPPAAPALAIGIVLSFSHLRHTKGVAPDDQYRLSMNREGRLSGRTTATSTTAAGSAGFPSRPVGAAVAPAPYCHGSAVRFWDDRR